MKKYLLFFVCGLVLVLSGCESKKENIAFNYYKDKDNVYRKYRKEWSFAYVYKKIENADPKSFEVLNKHISKDKDSIFIMFNSITGVDHDTFSVYGESNYAKDKDNIYFIDWKDLSEPVKIIKDADRNSFEFVQEKISTADYYAKDKNKVFLNERVLKDVDPNTLKFIDEFYYKDKDHVFVFDNRIKDADPETFELLEIGYSKDKNNIYYMGEKANVDIETFYFVKDFECAKDKNNYYYQGKIANKSNCESLIK